MTSGTTAGDPIPAITFTNSAIGCWSPVIFDIAVRSGATAGDPISTSDCPACWLRSPFLEVSSLNKPFTSPLAFIFSTLGCPKSNIILSSSQEPVQIRGSSGTYSTCGNCRDTPLLYQCNSGKQRD